MFEKRWPQLLYIAAFAIFLNPLSARANGWSWSLGYNNPPGATVGINFMHLWTNWAFEVGVGAIEAKNEDDTNSDTDKKTLHVGGDVDLKYLFGNSWFRPYIQAGMGAGVGIKSDDDTSAGAGVGGSYCGGGVFLMGNPFYLYASLNTGTFVQVGLGFDF